MNKNITGKYLIDLGWKPGLEFGIALKKINNLIDTGTKVNKAVELIGKPIISKKIELLDKPNKLNVALDINQNDKWETNTYKDVMTHMNDLLHIPIVKRGVVMPDACPAGNGKVSIPVGGAIAVNNAIIPGAHSADICCSMYASFFENDKNLPVSNMMDNLQKSTRFGPGGRDENKWVEHPILDFLDMEQFKNNLFLSNLDIVARKHMADQGDGNHFAYIGKIVFDGEAVLSLRKNGNDALAKNIAPFIDKELTALVTHHGSRSLGAIVYKRGQKVAIKNTNKIANNIPKSACWIDYGTDEGKQYWEALQYVSLWTKANHESIHRIFRDNIESEIEFTIGNEHNFVWKRGDTFLHGKGVTPAWKNEFTGAGLVGLIPLNMSSEILLVFGNNNEKFLSFAPHGAGRNFSRNELKKRYLTDGIENKDDIINNQNRGLDIRWYNGNSDISETAIAYKNKDSIKKQIEKYDLATVFGEIKPLGCIMAGENLRVFKKR